MANNAVLIQQAFPSHRAMLELTEPIHRAYCEHHAIDYACVYVPEVPQFSDRGPNWSKLDLIRSYLDMDMQYDYVIWLDNDALIVGNEDLREAVPAGIGMARHELNWGKHSEMFYNHFNSGTIYLRNTPAVREFCERWWNTPDAGHPWGDQHALHLCAQANPGIVSEIGHRWNSTPPYFEVPDAVVRAWHGVGEAPARTAIMKEAVDSLLSGGDGRESPYCRAKLRAAQFWWELNDGMGKASAPAWAI